MATVFETIENSAVIQQAKADFAAAKAKGDQAGMTKARNTAETYRQNVGGYSTVGDGSAIKDILDSNTYYGIYETINDTVKTANNVVNKVTETVKQTTTEAVNAAKQETVTVIDSANSGYNASDYSISTSSSSNFDTYLEYGLIGLILIAVLSRFIGK